MTTQITAADHRLIDWYAATRVAAVVEDAVHQALYATGPDEPDELVRVERRAYVTGVCLGVAQALLNAFSETEALALAHEIAGELVGLLTTTIEVERSES